jgi:hypothetical protein
LFEFFEGRKISSPRLEELIFSLTLILQNFNLLKCKEIEYYYKLVNLLKFKEIEYYYKLVAK